MTANATIALNNRLVALDRPLIMGIMNVTPDSFYAGSRAITKADLEEKARALVSEGADIVDIGGCSTRPGSTPVDAEEEYRRLAAGIEVVKREAPDMIVSIDTFRAEVASRCIAGYGIDIINDISGGIFDPEIQDVAAETHTPYVLTHMRGTPADMLSHTDYPRGIVAEVIEDLARKADSLHSKGVADVIIDPGFGFAKTLSQNYELLDNLEEFKELGMPLLVGLSRKRMVYVALGTSPEDSETLWGTIALNTKALMLGVDILRVHDVKAAVAVRKLLSC